MLLPLHHHGRILRLASYKWLRTQTISPQRSLSTTATLSPLPWNRPQASPQSLLQTKQSHAVALIHGHLPQSVTISASLILSYATYGEHITSRRLFEDSVRFSRSAFFWNTLIRAYSIAGVDYGLEVYNRMIRNGVRPDDHTFPFVFNACSKFSKFLKGLEIHGLVFKLGFDEDLFVGNTLLLFYGGCGKLTSVDNLFDEMCQRDAVSWNTVIRVFAENGHNHKAIELFHEMRFKYLLAPNLVTIVSVLPVCAGLEDEATAREIHCYILKIGLYSHVNIGNALVDVYGKCKNIKASKRVFDEMLEKNDVSWNSLITSYAYTRSKEDALNMLKSMINHGVKPNSVTISSILPVLVELEYFKTGKEIHGYSIRTGNDSDIFIKNSLIDLYAKAGKLTEASNIFNQMRVKNVVSWNAMIANFAQNGLELASINLITEMQNHGDFPNSVSFTNVLPACARIGALCTGKEIHARSIRTGPTSDLFVSNALTDMYAKCGSLKLAQNVFNMSDKDEVSYNILIVGYSQTSFCEESLTLFREMQLLGLNHDAVSFVGALSACANFSAIKQGKEIHGILIRKNFHNHLFVANSLSDLYTKCGKIEIAREIFNRRSKKDVASWNTMILGYGMLGEITSSIDLFEAMKNDNVEYDSVSYIAILSTCSHGGLLEKGKNYFKEMQEKGIKPDQMHYACMVDLLGRAGHLNEAFELIKSLPIKPDANVWGALLGACRIHGNLDLACLAAENLFRLKPEHSGYYVLLSNMYAEAGKWDEADKLRKVMKSRGVDKNVSCSWVQVRDRVHMFGVGEKIEKLKSRSRISNMVLTYSTLC